MQLIEFKSSPNCLRVRMACRYKNISVTSVEIDPLDRREVEKLSGQKTVPVLIDGGKILDDSTTILRYLDKKFPDPPLFPAQGEELAKNEILVEWGNEVFRRSVEEMFKEAFKKETERDADKIQKASRNYNRHLRLLEKWLSTETAYLAGERITASDIIIYPFVTYAILPEKLKDHPLYGLHYTHFALPDPCPFLKNWLQRLKPLSDWETRPLY